MMLKIAELKRENFLGSYLQKKIIFGLEVMSDFIVNLII
jgi:hypothetical protein